MMAAEVECLNGHRHWGIVYGELVAFTCRDGDRFDTGGPLAERKGVRYAFGHPVDLEDAEHGL